MNWKATLARVVFLVLLTAWTLPAFAEVQNVKIGGDLTTYGIYRRNLRLSDDRTNGAGGGTGNVLGPSGDNFFQSHAGLNVNADLTENVSTELRLISQRVWGSLSDNATTVDGSVTDANQVDVALANVTLKELFYAPLTVKIGRQNLWFGRGFIIGTRLLASDADPSKTIGADEFSSFTGFDAIRGTLDLSQIGGVGVPLTLDAVYSKIAEHALFKGDDVTLLGLNLGTHVEQWNTEGEVYFWSKIDDSLGSQAGVDKKHADINTLGVRGSVAPVKGSSIFGEMAYQFGRRATTAAGLGVDAEGAAGGSQEAWAFDLGAEYTATEVAMTPKIGLEWIFYSGKDVDGAINGWDPMFRGKFNSALREFQAVGLYMPAQSGATTAGGSQGTFNNLTDSYSNQHQLMLYGDLKPLEDLNVASRFSVFATDVGIIPTPGAKRKNYLGSEWDTQVTYHYTGDVQLGLIYGIFWPGDVFRTPYDAVAQELVSSLSVKF